MPLSLTGGNVPDTIEMAHWTVLLGEAAEKAKTLGFDRPYFAWMAAQLFDNVPDKETDDDRTDS